eukprot:151508_1
MSSLRLNILLLLCLFSRKGVEAQSGCKGDCLLYGIGDDRAHDGDCEADEFKCVWKGANLCTPNTWKCDGYKDCDDNSDETNGCNGNGRFTNEESESTTSTRARPKISVFAIVALSVVVIVAIGAGLFYCCRRQKKTFTVIDEEDAVDTKGLRSEDQMMDTNPLDMQEELVEVDTVRPTEA